MLAEERPRLHALPSVPYTAAFGETHRVSWSARVSYGGVTYSVPHTLADQVVWVRADDEEFVAVHVSGREAVEVAPHRLSTPGHPVIDDSHYPPRPPGALGRQPKATDEGEAAFLALGEGALLWLVEATAAGACGVRVKMAEGLTQARCTAPTGWTGRSGMPPSMAVSATVTRPPSWLPGRPNPADAYFCPNDRLYNIDGVSTYE